MEGHGDEHWIADALWEAEQDQREFWADLHREDGTAERLRQESLAFDESLLSEFTPPNKAELLHYQRRGK